METLTIIPEEPAAPKHQALLMPRPSPVRKQARPKPRKTSNIRKDDDEKADRTKVPDGGRGWAVVFAAFVIESCGFGGFSRAAGVFYAALIQEFSATEMEVSWAISILSALAYGGGLFSSMLYKRFGARPLVFVGGIVSSLGFFTSSYVTNVYELYVTMGVVVGTGWGLAYNPALVAVGQNFDKKRHLAYGVVLAGTGVGGFAFSPLFQYLISLYGWRKVLQIYAGMNLSHCAAALLLRSPRTTNIWKNTRMSRFNLLEQGRDKNLPASQSCKRDLPENNSVVSLTSLGNESKETEAVSLYPQHRRRSSSIKLPSSLKFRRRPRASSIFVNLYTKDRPRIFDVSLLRHPPFLVLCACVVANEMSYLVAPTQMVPRALSLQIPKTQASFLPSVLSITDLIGRLLSGLVSKVPGCTRAVQYAVFCMLWSASSLAIILGVTYPQMAALAGMYGLFNGLVRPLTTALAADVVGTERIESGLGLVMLCQGVGSVVGLPISGALYDMTEKYYPSFLFAGAAIFLSGVFLLCAVAIEERRKHRNREPLISEQK
ncbi:monocarboxylate transporter 13-like [Branchiostoma floridae x Branchiostoma belcheri]